jgi:ABC-type multidrug transport system ATPase subunit
MTGVQDVIDSSRDGQFQFTVKTGWPPESGRFNAVLTTDRWDDFGFKTMFKLYVFDREGSRHDCGYVKIGQFGLRESPTPLELPESFVTLGDEYFALGQDEDYYRTLSGLAPDIRDLVVAGLHDLVADLPRFDMARGEDVMRVSILRSVSSVTVQSEFRRILYGDESEPAYRFSFVLLHGEGDDTLTFDVRPGSEPPTNVHVLVGTNGSGKTHILNGMTDFILGTFRGHNMRGKFIPPEADGARGFAGLVLVSFSAFDEFRHRRERESLEAGIRYAYVGLRASDGSTPLSEGELSDQLTSQFVKALGNCTTGSRQARWNRAIGILESDPGFKQLEARAKLMDGAVGDEPAEAAASFFRQLSSGHKIVLLTMTRLVETVRERTLVLIDEPESHLHPPLLSAFIRAVSDLLAEQNGVAVIATHSPVVLQEVPRSCVCKIRRSGLVMSLDPPTIETFGENVGVLTREVFSLDVTKSGFHWLLEQAIEAAPDSSMVAAHFGDQLGSEARAIVHGLVAADAEHPEA